MCRFLIVRSRADIQPAPLLDTFAQMCAVSRGPAGGRQADGWGVAWRLGETWQLRKSLQPIWDEAHAFAQLPESQLWVVHARGASFDEHRGQLSHNQPYVSDSLCFVFNGMLRGVRLPMKTVGEIGAQKIFALVRRALESQDGEHALRWLDDILVRHSRQVIGLNIGIVQANRIYLLCEYGQDAAYFGLNYVRDEDFTIVCSEKLPGFQWQTMAKGQVLAL